MAEVLVLPRLNLHVRFTRRELLAMLGVGALGVALDACGSAPRGNTSLESADFSSRFAQYPVADEPNGDLAKVVWPAFVTRAGPEIQGLYEFQVLNGDLMRYMPCFCGCGADGHRNNRDCYVKQVNSDDSIIFDAMAPT